VVQNALVAAVAHNAWGAHVVPMNRPHTVADCEVERGGRMSFIGPSWR